MLDNRAFYFSQLVFFNSLKCTAYVIFCPTICIQQRYKLKAKSQSAYIFCILYIQYCFMESSNVLYRDIGTIKNEEVYLLLVYLMIK